MASRRSGNQSTALGRVLRYLYQSLDYARGGSARKASNPVLLQLVNAAARSGGSSQDSANLEYYMRLAVTAPHFYAAAQTVADRVSEAADFAVEEQRGDRWQKVDNHELMNVLDHPNPLMTAGLVMGTTAWEMQATGNAYWFLVTDTPGQGPIREIWPLPSLKTQPDPTTLRVSPITGQLIVDYRYNLGTDMLLPGENVLHVRAPNLFDFWRGMAPLSALSRILEMDYSETNWLAGYFGEGNAVPTAIISVPPEITDEEFDAVKRDIVEQFGAQRRSAITRAGDMSVETIQHTVDDMKILDGLGYNAEAIRAVLRVPTGLRDTSSGQSRLAAENALLRDAVMPMLRNIAQWMTLKVIPFYASDARQRVTVLTEVPQDSSIAIAEYEAYGQDRTVNEQREERKMEPLKLTGQMAEYQFLLDEIPLRYATLIVQLMTAKQQAAASGMPGAPDQAGQGAPTHPAVAAMMGNSPQAGPTHPAVAAMAGSGSPAAPRSGATGTLAPGVRTSGVSTPQQLVASLSGGAAKSFDGLGAGEILAMAAMVMAQSNTGDPSPVIRAGRFRAVVDGAGWKALYRVDAMGDGAERWATWNKGIGKWVDCVPVTGAIVVDGEYVRRQGAEV